MLPVPANTVDAVPTLKSSVPAKRVVAEKGKRLSVPAVILLFLASIIVGGGVTLGLLYTNGQFGANASAASKPIPLPTPGAATTPGASSTSTASTLPTPSSFQSITNAQLQVSLQYPGDWLADPLQTAQDGTLSESLHPQQAMSVAFLVFQFTPANSQSIKSAQDLNTTILLEFGQGNNLTNPQTLSNTPTQRTIAGLSWSEADAAFSLPSGDSLHTVSLAVKYKNHYYNILFFALSSQFDDAMQKYYTQMLGSFKFTV